MILKDVTVSASYDVENRRNFNQTTNCITALFVSMLTKINTGKYQKFTIELTERKISKKFDATGDVLSVLRNFNFNAYWKLTDIEKRKSIFNEMRKGLYEVFKYLKLPTNDLEKIFSAIQDRNYTNENTWKKISSSPDKKYKAKIYYLYGTKKIDVYIYVVDKKGTEIFKKKILETKPHDIWLNEVLGKLEWASDSEIILTSKDSTNQWHVNIV